MQVNAILSATDTNNKKITTTITHLRDSQKAQAVTLCQALNALTTNTYEGVKVNEINVDISSKQVPALSIGNFVSDSGAYQAPITYNGNGQLFLQCNNPAVIINNYIRVTTNTGLFAGTIYATETDNYYSTQATFSR